ncbi:MAG TPA: GNAT family N-acetyltransferase [Euzebyales bacterium]|nr:GNAT family N-acetyltransferase [Euzebyales bacterium]
MTAAVRRAQAHDVSALVDAYDWLFAPPGLVPPRWDAARAAATLRDLIDAPDAGVLVADDGVIVGFCTVYLDIRSVRFGQRAWIEDLAVHPERRSLGIGQRLLASAREWATDYGATHLELDSATTRTDAHRFYQRHEPSWQSVCFGWEL